MTTLDRDRLDERVDLHGAHRGDALQIRERLGLLRGALDDHLVVEPVALRLDARLVRERLGGGLRLPGVRRQRVEDELAAGGVALDLRGAAQVGLRRELDDEAVGLAAGEVPEQALLDGRRGGRPGRSLGRGGGGERRSRLAGNEKNRGHGREQTTRHRQNPPLTNRSSNPTPGPWADRANHDEAAGNRTVLRGVWRGVSDSTACRHPVVVRLRTVTWMPRGPRPGGLRPVCSGRCPPSRSAPPSSRRPGPSHASRS